MRRRQFLKSAVAGALASLATVPKSSAQMMGGGRMGGMMGSTTSLAWPTGQPLRRLGVLANEGAVAGAFEADLVATPFNASLVTGRTTSLWGYNGAYPGPVIELREGQRVAIDFANGLGLDSTVHWHGLAVPADQDGSPMDPVAPGARRVYAFDVPAGSAGTYWYHPHAHGTTTLQVGRGLAAPLIVRPASDPLAAVPEETLMVTAMSLDSSGQVATSSMGGMGGMGGMGMTTGGGELLVNGQKQPVLTATPGATQRWRILNATADRYLRLALDGHRFAVVATDGGLLTQPVSGLSEWLLAPAQRVEIVVTLSTRPGMQYLLRDLGYGGGMMMSPGTTTLMAVTTSRTAALAPIALPAALRPAAVLGPPSVRQQVVLSSTGMMGMGGSFLINGRSFDMNRVDLRTIVGRVEEWDLVNATMMDHPIHIHGTQFQVVRGTLGGFAGTVADCAWFDTVNVPAGRTVTIRTRQDSPGKRMFHCHILPHEDAGMMAVLEVLAG